VICKNDKQVKKLEKSLLNVKDYVISTQEMDKKAVKRTSTIAALLLSVIITTMESGLKF
jgi:hypothetical protein